MSGAIDQDLIQFQERVNRILSEDPKIFMANQPILLLFAERYNYAEIFNQPQSDRNIIKNYIEMIDERIKLYLNLI